MWPAVITLSVLIAFALGFHAGRWIPPFQNLGEAMVANTINLGLQRPHLLVNNVTLQIGERTSQIDHVLIADTGIFVIETKHYAGWIFGDAQGGQWTQVIYQKKSKFLNPVRQNYGHLKALRALFNLPEDNFFSLVVFTGRAEFKTDLRPTVLRLPDLLAYLGADRPVLFDERQMTYIVGRIEMKRMRRSLETDEYHINHIRKRAKAFGS